MTRCRARSEERSPVGVLRSDPVPERWRAGEGGFVLIAVLGTVLVATTIIVALLGLSFTTTTFSGQQIERDVETQAANSALDAAVNELQRSAANPTPDSGSGEQCPPFSLFQPGLDQYASPTLNVDGVDVRVACKPQTSSFPYVAESTVNEGSSLGVCPDNPLPDDVCFPADYSPNERKVEYSVEERVRLLGSDYGTRGKGSLEQRWQEASEEQRQLLEEKDATLVHEGGQTLPFTSPVEVRAGALGLFTGQSGGPAISVGADYRQGDPGWDAATGCGSLSADPLTPFSLRTLPESGLVCGSPEASGLSPTAPAAAVPPRGGWRWSLSETSDGTGGRERGLSYVDLKDLDLWTNPSSDNCENLKQPLTNARPTKQAYRIGNVIFLRPGAYTGESARILNRWFDVSSGTCTDKIIWFLPDLRTKPAGATAERTEPEEKRGQFYFDVAQAPHALKIDNPSLVVVFGQMKGSDLPIIQNLRDDFPEACDTNQRGVRVELSSRTSLQHRSGLVSLCDRGVPQEKPESQFEQRRFVDRPEPVIWQTQQLSGRWPAASGGNTPAIVSPQFYRYRPDWELKLFSSSIPTRLDIWCDGNNYCVRQRGRDILGTSGEFRITEWPPPAEPGGEVVGVEVFVEGSYTRLSDSSFAEVLLTRGNLTCSATPIDSIGNSPNDVSTARRTFSARLQVDLTGDCSSVFAPGPDGELTVAEVAEVDVAVRAGITPNCEGERDFIVYKLKAPTLCPGEKPFLEFTEVSLETQGTDVGALGAPLQVTVKREGSTSASAAPAARRAEFVAWGQISAPLADLDITWKGTDRPVYPLFNGSMWLNGIGSGMVAEGSATGVVCCVPGQSAERQFRLHARVGGVEEPDLQEPTPLRLLATAQVTIQDWRPQDLGPSVYQRGYLARVSEWRLCANNSLVNPDTVQELLASECLPP